MRLKKLLFVFLVLFLCSVKVYAISSIDVGKLLKGVDDVDVTFSYEIEASSSNPDNTNFSPNNFEISFDQNSIIEDDNASNSYTLDFGSLNYSKPGKYEYIVRETMSSNESIYPKDNNYFTIILNVLNELDENNNPTGNLIVDVLQNAFVNETSGKGEILFKTAPLTYITLSKSVTGDLADMNEYFKFKIDIDGDNFAIIGQDSSVIYNGEVINTIDTYDDSKDNYVYLKHGQSITIGLNNGEYQIPSDVSYNIEEMDATNYKTYINKSKNDYKAWVMHTYNTPESNNVSYVNNQESTVLTGVFVSILPYALMISLSIIGIYVLKKKSKKTDNN